MSHFAPTYKKHVGGIPEEKSKKIQLQNVHQYFFSYWGLGYPPSPLSDEAGISVPQIVVFLSL